MSEEIYSKHKNYANTKEQMIEDNKGLKHNGHIILDTYYNPKYGKWVTVYGVEKKLKKR